MRVVLIVLAVIVGANCVAQTHYMEDMFDDSYPPVLLNNPDDIVYLKDSIDIPEERYRGFGKFFIGKNGNIDSVLCYHPVNYTEKLETFCEQAVFRGGVCWNRFVDMELDFYLNFLDFHPTTKAKIGIVNTIAYHHENGEIEILPAYDENDYNIVFRNAKFNRDFPKRLDQTVEFVEFNILVDSINKINRSGRYLIPERQGYSVRINSKVETERFLLINVRRNCQIILNNDLDLNLEKDDHYLLLCQNNRAYESQFYIEEFTLTGDRVINPQYQNYTYSQLREKLTTKWGKRKYPK